MSSNLDVRNLLESSQPRARAPWLGPAALAMVLAGVMATVWGESAGGAGQAMVGLALLGLMAVGVAAMIGTAVTVRKHRAEAEQLLAVEELVQLRHWPQAAAILEGMLSQPTRTEQGRIQGLLYLTAVLTRYHRFDDAITVHDYLLNHVQMEPGTDHAIRAGRAMAMLRADHLFDADRAISELRRTPGAEDSGVLALVELYRHVKTGHPDDALELFGRKLTVLQKQLGHRVADAWALVARAYDFMGRQDEARDAYAKATLLCPPLELHRRYPELKDLAGKYAASLAPGEGA